MALIIVEVPLLAWHLLNCFSTLASSRRRRNKFYSHFNSRKSKEITTTTLSIEALSIFRQSEENIPTLCAGYEEKKQQMSTYKHIQDTLRQPILLPPEKRKRPFLGFGLHKAPSHYSTVLFVLSAASLPASTASSTPLLLLLLWPS